MLDLPHFRHLAEPGEQGKMVAAKMEELKAAGHKPFHTSTDARVFRAVAYVDSAKTPDPAQISASGFEVETIGEGAEATLMVAVDTMGIAPRVDCVVLAPRNPRLEHLAKTLRSQGLRVETAGFNPEEEAAGSHRALGRDSMFVP